MPTVRRPLRRNLRRRISPAAIASWQAADFKALHSALGLGPHEASPLPETIISLGVSEESAALVRRKGSSRCFEQTYAQAIELQRELMSVAGWPDCKNAYEENLREAEDWAAYCAELIEHPERGHKGTGSDPKSRRAALKEALAEVEFRKRLLFALAQP